MYFFIYVYIYLYMHCLYYQWEYCDRSSYSMHLTYFWTKYSVSCPTWVIRHFRWTPLGFRYINVYQYWAFLRSIIKSANTPLFIQKIWRLHGYLRKRAINNFQPAGSYSLQNDEWRKSKSKNINFPASAGEFYIFIFGGWASSNN